VPRAGEAYDVEPKSKYQEFSQNRFRLSILAAVTAPGTGPSSSKTFGRRLIMKIVYHITEEDFMEAHDLFVANEKWVRRMSRRTMPWMGGLILLLSIVILSPRVDLIVSVPSALMGAYFLYCGFALRRFFRKQYRKDQRYKHEITADISEDGVHVVTPSADTQLKWSAIVRFLESDKIFMFFYAEWSFSVVPKRAFAPGEIDPFRDMLHRKILASK